MDLGVADALRKASRSSLCNQQLDHISYLATTWHPNFRELLVALAKRFTELSASATKRDLDQRMIQASAASSLA
jgi:hypothetical protein